MGSLANSSLVRRMADNLNSTARRAFLAWHTRRVARNGCQLLVRVMSGYGMAACGAERSLRKLGTGGLFNVVIKEGFAEYPEICDFAKSLPPCSSWPLSRHIRRLRL